MLYLVGVVGDGEVWRETGAATAGGLAEACAAGGAAGGYLEGVAKTAAVSLCEVSGSGGRGAGSLSRADLDRGFAMRRSAMDYAIGRQAGGGSDGRRRRWKHDSLMDRHGRCCGVRCCCGCCCGVCCSSGLRWLEDGLGMGMSGAAGLGTESGRGGWWLVVGWLAGGDASGGEAMVRWDSPLFDVSALVGGSPVDVGLR